MSCRSILVLVAIALGTGGCSDPIPETDTGTPPKDAGEEDGLTQCTSDKDCSAQKKVCDPLKKQCVDCLLDRDCNSSEHCKAYKCVAYTSCKNSKDCTSVKGKPICSQKLGECVACDADTDCSANQNCINHTCVTYTPCKNSKDCSNQVCDPAKGRCVDCLTASDGKSYQECVASKCKTFYPCKSDKDCTGKGMLCDKAAGRCKVCLQVLLEPVHGDHAGAVVEARALPGSPGEPAHSSPSPGTDSAQRSWASRGGCSIPAAPASPRSAHIHDGS